MALRSIAFQAAVVAGPALGGLLFAIRPEARLRRRGRAVRRSASSACSRSASPPCRARPRRPSAGLRSVLGGIHFIRRSPMLLGAISLDLFAVLFGGAVALLPLFARSILHTGPVGLGDPAQRAGDRRDRGRHLADAPPAQAARRPDAARRRRRVRREHGRLRALALLRALDRRARRERLRRHDQHEHPRHDRRDRRRRTRSAGGCSRSRWCSSAPRTSSARSSPGVAATLFGAVTAVVAGGAVTIALAVRLARSFFPALAKIDRIEDLRPATRTRRTA